MENKTSNYSIRPAVRKIPARFAGLVMPFNLSIIMTFVISGVSTIHSIGFPPNLPMIWAQAWGWSWVVAFPTLLVVLPLVRHLVNLIVEKA